MPRKAVTGALKITVKFLSHLSFNVTYKPMYKHDYPLLKVIFAVKTVLVFIAFVDFLVNIVDLAE